MCRDCLDVVTDLKEADLWELADFTDALAAVHASEAAERRAWITQEEAGAIIGCSRPTVAKLLRAGHLTQRAVGAGRAGRCTIERVSVESYAEERAAQRERRQDVQRERHGPSSANSRRTALAAEQNVARVRRALEILGQDVPEQLRTVGEMRVRHEHASLIELGGMHHPVLTKDAFAGRLRRLLEMAEQRVGGAAGASANLQLA